MRFSAFKRLSIVARIALAGSLSLVLFALAMLAFVKSELEAAIYSQTQTRLTVASATMRELIARRGTPAIENGTLHFGSTVPGGDEALVDRVRAITGADVTIFSVIDGRPIRVATTIPRAGGRGRNLGTELADPARTAVARTGRFTGVTTIAGRPYLDDYEALYDADGRTVGIAYAGIPLTAMVETVSSAMRTVAFGTLVALVASLSLLFLVMRPVRRALRNAVTMAQGLARGDVDQRSDEAADDELGQVSLAFHEMISYQQRMAAVADALARGDFSTPVVPVSDRDRLGIAFADMSENLKGLVEQLERSAMTDSLTKLGNRRAFDQRMRAELERAARHQGIVWLALVDVDNFKRVNDENGHQHGDVVLSKLATVLGHLRAEDSAYRLGGDEFAVVLSDCTAKNARTALDRMRDEASRELFGTTISIGLAGSRNGAIDSSILQRQADAALYVCKQRGRNVVVSFEETQRTATDEQQHHVRAVTRLIAEQQLGVAYQPIWDLTRRAILGFEALARPNATYGLSGPQQAFDVASSMGRTHDLDRVCRQAAIAAAQGLPAGALLFLNVSPETLARRDFNPAQLAAELFAVGVAVDRVVLEISERYAGALEPVISAASELQRFGFKIALDDTGASDGGLILLQRIRFDFIKIDAAIAARTAGDLAARGIVSAVVALARTTNAYVIVEGIEDRATLDLVRAAGVDGVQGYLVGRPDLTSAAVANAPAVEALLSGASANVTTLATRASRLHAG